MKKLLLFALLCVPAFGQVHSDIATQNTVGNWVKAIPGAFIYVCDPNTTNANCLIGLGGTTLYTDANLSVTLAQPITADSNGNYTFYATPGIYNQCVKGTTSFCQLIEVAGIGTPVGVPFTCPSAVNGSVMGMTSTTTSSCDPNGITDFIGHWTSQSYRATGAFNGTVELTGGLADPTNPPDTNSVAFLAPLTVPTPYYLRPPASTGSVGQCLQLLSQASGTNGTINALQWATCGTGSGSVTSFSAGNLSPLFTTSVATATTTPALTFALSNAAANTIFGNFTGSSGAPSYNAISACGDSTHALAWTAGTGFTCQAISAGATSVGLTVNGTSPSGIFTVTGSPVTTSGSLNFNLAGTSGGVPYFSSSTVLSSSGALTANLPVFGGGAGSAPIVGTRSGNTTEVGTVTGSLTNGDCIKADANGNLVDAGAACSSGGGADTFVFDQCTPAQSTNSGNSFYTTNAFTNWDAGVWEFLKNTNADIWCSIKIPSSSTASPHIVIDLFANDSTNAHTATFSICDVITSSLNPNVGACSASATQNYSSTTTAYAVTTLSFAPSATITTGQVLVVKIHQASGGANTADILMYPPHYKIN